MKQSITEELRAMLILFLLAFCFIQSQGQIVNIESKRSNKLDSINWNGSVNLGFTLVDNGKQVMTIKGNFRLEHIRGSHLFLSITDFKFGKIDKDGFQNEGFQHLRYNYSIKPRIIWEAFSQIQYNEKIKLRFRGLAGTGPRFGIIHKDPFYLYAGIMYMYEYNEEEYGDPQVIHYFQDHRISTYVSFSLKPLDNLHISSTSYFQPVISDFSNLRLSSVTSMNIYITEKLQFTNSFNITYDSRVPEDVPNTIYGLASGLKYSF